MNKVVNKYDGFHFWVIIYPGNSMELFDYHSHLFTPIYYMLACFPSTVLTEYVIVMTVLFLIAGELTFCCSPNSSILYDILQIPYSTTGSVGRNKAYVTCDIYI